MKIKKLPICIDEMIDNNFYKYRTYPPDHYPKHLRQLLCFHRYCLIYGQFDLKLSCMQCDKEDYKWKMNALC